MVVVCFNFFAGGGSEEEMTRSFEFFGASDGFFIYFLGRDFLSGLCIFSRARLAVLFIERKSLHLIFGLFKESSTSLEESFAKGGSLANEGF